MLFQEAKEVFFRLVRHYDRRLPRPDAARRD
jgi:hypothetical protein